MSNPPLTPLGSALAGALGACFSNAVVYPLDTVKTRLQALPSEGTLPAPTPKEKGGRFSLKRWRLLTMLIRIIRTEGISGTFKGFTANMIGTFSMQFVYFFFHTWIRGTTLQRLQAAGRSTKLSTSSELLVGAAAGALAQVFTIPVSVIATRQQIWTPENGSKTRTPSLFETGAEVIQESGVSGLWTGLKPGLILTVNPAITYGVFERLKSAVLHGARENGKLAVGEAFWIGVGSKAIATIVTYPYIFAKVRLQARKKAPSVTTDEVKETYAEVVAEKPHPPRHSRHDGAIPLLRAVYKEKGFGGWYQGLAAQILKAALCQGILFVSKDQFEKWAWVIISLLTGLKKRVRLE